jgi:hypothetical protein
MKITEQKLRQIIQKCLQESFMTVGSRMIDAGITSPRTWASDTGNPMSAAMIVSAEADEMDEDDDIIDEDDCAYAESAIDEEDCI